MGSLVVIATVWINGGGGLIPPPVPSPYFPTFPLIDSHARSCSFPFASLHPPINVLNCLISRCWDDIKSQYFQLIDIWNVSSQEIENSLITLLVEKVAHFEYVQCFKRNNHSTLLVSLMTTKYYVCHHFFVPSNIHSTFYAHNLVMYFVAPYPYGIN